MNVHCDDGDRCLLISLQYYGDTIIGGELDENWNLRALNSLGSASIGYGWHSGFTGGPVAYVQK
jgi:hypothetical protein